MYYHIMLLQRRYPLSRIHLDITHNLVANVFGIFMFCFQLTELQTTLRDREATIQEMTTHNESLETKVGRLSRTVDSTRRFVSRKLREVTYNQTSLCAFMLKFYWIINMKCCSSSIIVRITQSFDQSVG